MSSSPRPINALPGILLCIAVSVAAYACAAFERIFFGHPWIEPLVLAILIGAVIRAVWEPGPEYQPGIAFTAKTLLEVAVALLGASISASAVAQAGIGLLAGIAVLVPVVIAAAYGIGRALGLAPRVAILAACGNAICGNSAIAAVAPVIGATGAEVGTAIAFTAILGIVVVLMMPLALYALHMSAAQYGAFAGLTVYAVPQVLAAASAGGPVAVQIGTLAKLVRVLMLGPVVAVFAFKNRAASAGTGMSLKRYVPWFIAAFLVLMALRSFGAIPAGLLAPIESATLVLTVMAMAALGLQCNVREIAKAGLRVSLAVTLSLIVLGVLAYGLILGLGIS